MPKKESQEEKDKEVQFICSLLDHLKERYRTEFNDFPDKRYRRFSNSSKKDSELNILLFENENSKGFYFKKSQCDWAPDTSSDITDDIYDFVSEYENLEAKIVAKEGEIELKIEDTPYLITSGITSPNRTAGIEVSREKYICVEFEEMHPVVYGVRNSLEE